MHSRTPLVKFLLIAFSLCLLAAPSALPAQRGSILVRPDGTWRTAVLPWRLAGTDASVGIADSAFSIGGATYPAGTLIVNDAGALARKALTASGTMGVVVGGRATPPQHELRLPRVALVSRNTPAHRTTPGYCGEQERRALVGLRIPYSELSDGKLAKTPSLDAFDVLVFTYRDTEALALSSGKSIAPGPIAAKLRRFLDRGGLILAIGRSDTATPIGAGHMLVFATCPFSSYKANHGAARAITAMANWNHLSP